MRDGWPAVLWTDRHPHAARNGVGELVKGQRRDQTYDALRHELGRFGEHLVRVTAGVRKLIEPAAEL
jgi:hypothetical protein